MGASFTNGTVVFRAWKKDTGLSETRVEFATLDEMFRLCLEAGDPPLVDRVVVEGTDSRGEPRTLTLAFQSITRKGEPPASG
jgi:hypothetical protein